MTLNQSLIYPQTIINFGQNTFDKLFNYTGIKVKTVVMIVMILVEATILYLGLPYRSILLKIIYLVSVQVLIFVGCLATYALVGMGPLGIIGDLLPAYA